MTRRRGSTLVLALAAVAALACSEHQDPMSPDDGNGNGQNSQVVEVELVNFAFDQATVTIDVGTTVRWRNTTNTGHTVTPDGHSAWEEWQTGAQGETFEVTFEEAGTYPYFCVPHQGIMTGTIIVQ